METSSETLYIKNTLNINFKNLNPQTLNTKTSWNPFTKQQSINKLPRIPKLVEGPKPYTIKSVNNPQLIQTKKITANAQHYKNGDETNAKEPRVEKMIGQHKK